jgi:UDP-glucose/iron transport system permease protein
VNSAADINWFNLGLGYILLLIPIVAFWYYQTGLVKDTITAVLRMTVQLILVGIYLEFIFARDSAWINLLWVLVMILAASYTTIQKSGLNYKIYLVPAFIALAASIVIVDLYFFAVVIKLNNIFEAVYIIPITGMLLGNCIRTNVIGLNLYYKRLKDDQTLYKYALANGASFGEALNPYIKEALRTAFNPTIATIAVIGLISLPGMMTGQILGGNSPMIAIKYQIMLMITILVSSVITVLITIFISNKLVFNGFYILKDDVIRKKKTK